MVEVRLMQRQDHSLYFEVLVNSRVKTNPQMKMKGILEHPDTTKQKVGLLAGALAEELCERHGSDVDPSEAARYGMEAYRELLMDNPHVAPGDELPREYDRAISAGVARR
jgi:hypothetical protein